jgi:homoserine kinase
MDGWMDGCMDHPSIGWMDVITAAAAAAAAPGAYGCTISGAGPTAVAVVPDPDVGSRVIEAMRAAFKAAGSLKVNSGKVVRLDPQGAKFVG